ISKFLQREDSYAIPARQRHLTVLILRKLLASSSHAIAGTLATLGQRLVDLRDEAEPNDNWTDEIITAEEIEEELLGEWMADEDEVNALPTVIDPARLRSEIDELAALAAMANAIGTDTQSKALLTALDIGFAEQARMGAGRKALILTESRRTQNYPSAFPESHAYARPIT